MIVEIDKLHQQVAYCGREMNVMWEKQPDMKRLGLNDPLPHLTNVLSVYNRSCTRIAAIGKEYISIRAHLKRQQEEGCCESTMQMDEGVGGGADSDELAALMAELDKQLQECRALILETSVVDKFGVPVPTV